MASIIILAVVFVLDVLAFVLAIGAERRRSYVRPRLHPRNLSFESRGWIA